MIGNARDSTTPPGWPFVLLSVALTYGPLFLVDVALFVIDCVRRVDNALAELGSTD